MTQKENVLVVDDEPNIQMLLLNILQPLYNVTTAGSGEEALTLAGKTGFDLVLLDMHLPQMSGLEVLEALKYHHPHIAVIILTGGGSIDSAVCAMRQGAVNYLQKPVTSEGLLENVHDGLVQARRERQQNAVLLKARKLLEAGLEQLDEITPDQTDLLAEAGPEEQAQDPDRFLQSGPLLIDTYRRKATLNEVLLDLTAGEYDLLLCLAQQAPQVLGPRKLVEQTRNFQCSLSEAREIIRWQVYLLRQKIEVDPAAPQYILNVRGRGYMWAAV